MKIQFEELNRIVSLDREKEIDSGADFGGNCPPSDNIKFFKILGFSTFCPILPPKIQNKVGSAGERHRSYLKYP